jgi:hypothetical protein
LGYVSHTPWRFLQRKCSWHDSTQIWKILSYR